MTIQMAKRPDKAEEEATAFHTFEMHTRILEEVAAQFEAIRKEKDAYIAEAELMPQSERTDVWKAEHKRRIEEYCERSGAIGDRWAELDAAVERGGPSGVN